MSAPPDAATRLCRTINRRILPDKISFDAGYDGGQITVHASAIGHLPSHVEITQDSDIQNVSLEPLLSAYADRLAECDDPEERASVYDTCQPLKRGAVHMLAGEHAARAWVMEHVLGEINALLDHWPIRSARAVASQIHQIGWRISTLDGSAQANFELYARSGTTINTLGILEYMSVSSETLGVIRSVARGGLTITSMPEGWKAESRYGALRETKQQDVLVQMATEWSRKKTRIAILSNYSTTYLFLADEPRSGVQTVRMSDPIHVFGLSSPGRISDSLVGFLLGVSLYAIESILEDPSKSLLQPVPAQVPVDSTDDQFLMDAARLFTASPDSEAFRPDRLGDEAVFLHAKERDTFWPAKHVSFTPRVLYGPYTPSSAARSLPSLRVAGSGVGNSSGPSDPLTIELGAHRGCGIVWDVFSATVTRPRTEMKLVVKLTDLSTFPEETLDRHTASRKNARALILAELQAYSGPLEALQGTAIPRFLGAAGTMVAGHEGGRQREIWAVFLEDAGSTLPGPFRSLPSTRRDVRALYAQLHALGVLHGDPKWEHIFARPVRAENDYRPVLRLIDFGHAKLRDELLAAEEDWPSAWAWEMKLVEGLFQEVD